MRFSRHLRAVSCTLQIKLLLIREDGKEEEDDDDEEAAKFVHPIDEASAATIGSLKQHCSTASRVFGKLGLVANAYCRLVTTT